MIRSNREIVGQLEYYSATPVNKHVQLVYVKFANESNHPNYITPAVLQSYLNSQSMNQLFIEFTVDSTHVKSTLNTSHFTGKTPTDIILEINEDVISQLTNHSFGNDYDCYFITNLNIPSGTGHLGGGHFPGDIGGYSVKNHSTTETNEELVAHELGHWFDLPHTFGTYNSRPNIPLINSSKGGTKYRGDNFMDYDLRRKRWFKVQLLNYKR